MYMTKPYIDIMMRNMRLSIYKNNPKLSNSIKHQATKTNIINSNPYKSRSIDVILIKHTEQRAKAKAWRKRKPSSFLPLSSRQPLDPISKHSIFWFCFIKGQIKQSQVLVNPQMSQKHLIWRRRWRLRLVCTKTGSCAHWGVIFFLIVFTKK